MKGIQGGSAALGRRGSRRGTWENGMISETEVHTIARRMIDQHGFEAVAEVARNAQICEGQGESEEAGVWRRIEGAMKIMRGPHQG
jgi:hypothetical protein